MTKSDLYKTREEIYALTDRLLDCSLPKTDWTHAAHLAATYCLLHHQSYDDLKHSLPGIIRRYNDVTGVVNSDSEGYHETITQAYLKAITHFIKRLPMDTGFVSGCHKLVSGPYGQKDFLLRYFSEQRLFSVAARRGWVEPDLSPLVFPEPE